MKKLTIFERMAKEPRLNISEGITSFISVPRLYKYLAEPTYADGIDYTVIEPAPICYNFDLTGIYPHASESHAYFLQKITDQKERDMQLLEKAGIPVFINDDTVARIKYDRYGTRIVAMYQIPEQLMYKSFWVLHSFEKATEYAGQYAMQQVQKVIDKY